MRIAIERPLVFLDIEGTGTDFEKDRIVEISTVRFDVDDSVDRDTRRLNPGVPIPESATKIHGITDADVADSESFADYAPTLFELLDDADFGGFNIVGYDLPILEAEFRRVGFVFDWIDRSCVDGYRIMVVQEKRDLAAALRFYCDRDLEDAHAAEADTTASIDVAIAQAERYGFETVGDLDAAGRNLDWADRTGKIRIADDGTYVFGFGKNQGKPLDYDVGYLRWMLGQTFPSDTVAIVRAVLSPPPR